MKISLNPRELWDDAIKKNKVEKFTEQEAFALNSSEVKKCRYHLIRQNPPDAECYIHKGNFSHGVRLFPKHLWDIKDGIVYFRRDKNSAWERWKPNILDNLKRLID